jgi:Protein of unknown function (DUF1553)/Protein of unknown function (DUF1549)
MMQPPMNADERRSRWLAARLSHFATVAACAVVVCGFDAAWGAKSDHWSFQPLQHPAPPVVQDAAWVRNEIDRFVLARLERAGLKPMPETDRAALIRRLAFDLTGLPPTSQEVDSFVNDTDPQAYEKLVDRLLASPVYGERWALYWLDLARFAESDGFEHDKVRTNAWQYRDWVIDALNADMPYDEFVRRQIAGDELYADEKDATVATGFLVCGPDMPDINLQEERRHVVLNAMTATVGEVFLGLQMGCAQCHDHKYDPITQADFYGLRAIFEPAFPKLKRDQPLGSVVHETGRDVPVCHVMQRGDFRSPGPVVEASFPHIANPWDDSVPDPASSNTGIGSHSTGRRSALAKWLTRPDHPLALRVIVNRLWQHHFNRGIVATPSDFGAIGDEPTHPLLLDWLATELPRRRWSLKAMHRLMVTSATYRQMSRPSDDTGDRWRRTVTADPGNKLLGRMNRRRLEGETIRDAMLAVAGRLSPRRGGPSVFPPLPKEAVATLLNADQWKVSADEEDQRRRSIYVFVRRNLRYPMFDAFDAPDTNASCPRRARSTTAPQSLMLLNSDFSLQAARGFAARVKQEAGILADADTQIRIAHRIAFARTPSDAELRLGRQFLQNPDGGLISYCLALLNLNEFIYID